MKNMQIVKKPLRSFATITALLAALFLAKPAGAQTAPTITAQPLSVATSTNGAALFTVSFSGSSNMVADWFLSGKFVFGTTNKAVLAATNSLVISDVHGTSTGSYIVVITNNWGRITSSVVTLTITNAPVGTDSAPAILLEPQSVAATNGATATFSVIVAGSPDMVVDWYFNGQYVSGTTNQGALTATNSLVLPGISAASAGSYVVVITNDWGSVTSSAATLTIVTNSAPVILSQPQSISTTNNATATFSVVVAGSPDMVSQWFFNGQYMSGITNHGAFAATNSLVLPHIGTTNAGSYLVVITNDWGSITSSVATLTVTNVSGDGNPQISIVSGPSRRVMLNLVTTPGTSSRVWMATNLTPPVVWLPIATNVSGTDGTWQFVETNTSQSPVRFYRTSTP